jgi:hypothetical protein
MPGFNKKKLKQFSSITVPEISDQIVAIVGLFATFF